MTNLIIRFHIIYVLYIIWQESAAVMLLTCTEPIFDELESHQMALQAMQSSSAAGSFLDEVMKWQKRLQTIEAALTIWLEVQEKWVELEEVKHNTHMTKSWTYTGDDMTWLIVPNVLIDLIVFCFRFIPAKMWERYCQMMPTYLLQLAETLNS